MNQTSVRSIFHSGSILPLLSLLFVPMPASAQTLATDLIYTSIQPCRIIDTRVAGGLLAAGTSRTFNAVGVASPGSLNSQGGNPSGCPIPGFVAGSPIVQAIAVNLVAVGATGAGDFVAWPTDQTQPSASVLNYASQTALAGLNIANAVILPVRQDAQGNDITVKAQSAGSHLVADVVGYYSGLSRSSNTLVGSGALINLTAGTLNTAVGSNALVGVSTQSYNTAVGANALFDLNAAGDRNVAVGSSALDALNSGSRNIGIGTFAGDSNTGGSDNIYIGNLAPGPESFTIRIGTTGTQTSTFIAGISGATSSSGVPVFVNTSGQLGTATSSRRFKEEAEDMGDASDALMQLRPVVFRYKQPYDDGSRLPQYGLIAEEVMQVYPDLVQYDQDHQPLTVRYQFVNAMLLNEVQKQHRKVRALEEKLAEQRTQIEEQEIRLQRLEALAGRK